MRARWVRFALGLCCLIGAAVAEAQDTGVSYTIHHHYQAPRPLGMGDAFVAVANDYNAIFYNPAGLARRDDGELNMSIDGGLSAGFLTFASDISKAQNSGETDADKQESVLAEIENLYGKSFATRLNMFNGIWVRPKWGIAVIPMDMSTEMTFHKNVGPSVNTTVYMDSTVALAYADDWKSLSRSGRLSWGVTGKFINRGYFSKSINFIEVASDPNLVKSSDLREGFGVDADVGFLYTPILPDDGLLSLLRLARPTFGLVVRNVLETKFSSSMKLLNKESSEPPEQMFRVIDVGTRWEYPSFWLFSGRGVMDVRDIMHPSFSMRKGLHLGFEFDWTVASWWKGAYRVGLNQGYLTAGASALFALFNLDLVTYGEEVGTYSTPVENRVYALKMSINW